MLLWNLSMVYHKASNQNGANMVRHFGYFCCCRCFWTGRKEIPIKFHISTTNGKQTQEAVKKSRAHTHTHLHKSIYSNLIFSRSNKHLLNYNFVFRNFYCPRGRKKNLWTCDIGSLKLVGQCKYTVKFIRCFLLWHKQQQPRDQNTNQISPAQTKKNKLNRIQVWTKKNR